MTKRTVENDDFVAMVQRMHRALERRAIDDPTILLQMIMLAEGLSASVNVVIATSAAKYAMNRYAAPSAGEIAGALGMSKQAVSDRRKRGDRELFDRQMSAEPMSRRERLARTAAQAHADQHLGSWLARQAEAYTNGENTH